MRQDHRSFPSSIAQKIQDHVNEALVADYRVLIVSGGLFIYAFHFDIDCSLMVTVDGLSAID